MHLYRIRNHKNGKVYIGKTVHKNLSRRWREHLWAAKLPRYGYGIYAAIKKYGVENFTIESILETFDEWELAMMEIKSIEAAGSNHPKYGYNRTIGGDGVRGIPPTKEQLEASRKRMLLLWQDSDFRAKVVSGRLGYRVSDETKRLLSDFAKRGIADGTHPFCHSRTRTKEECRALGERGKLYWSDPQNQQRQRERYIGKPLSEIHKKNLTAAVRISNTDPEYRKKMSASITAWWAKRKEQKNANII
jgi:group I intron endonuclease